MRQRIPQHQNPAVCYQQVSDNYHERPAAVCYLSVKKRRNNDLNLLSATSHVKKRMNNSLGLLSATDCTFVVSLLHLHPQSDI